MWEVFQLFIQRAQGSLTLSSSRSESSTQYNTCSDAAYTHACCYSRSHLAGLKEAEGGKCHWPRASACRRVMLLFVSTWIPSWSHPVHFKPWESLVTGLQLVSDGVVSTPVTPLGPLLVALVKKQSLKWKCKRALRVNWHFQRQDLVLYFKNRPNRQVLHLHSENKRGSLCASSRIFQSRHADCSVHTLVMLSASTSNICLTIRWIWNNTHRVWHLRVHTLGSRWHK